MTIELGELAAVNTFIQHGRGSAGFIEDWSRARDIETGAILRFARAKAHACLQNIALAEASTGEKADREDVESAIAAVVMTALQVGVDAERRRRDARELPR